MKWIYTAVSPGKNISGAIWAAILDFPPYWIYDVIYFSGIGFLDTDNLRNDISKAKFHGVEVFLG